MKLLLCLQCQDVFKLNQTHRTCECGKSSGHYLRDDLHAVINGPAIPLGFANSELAKAIRKRPLSGMGEVFTAFVIPVDCPTVDHHP